jgi:septum formation protein
MKQLILASQSPRRQEILKKMGVTFIACPSQKEERINTNWTPDELVLHLAQQKADDVYEHQDNADCFVIGADTMVFLHDRPMGKPKDEAQAFAMLRSLSGQVHQVKTAVYLRGQNSRQGLVCTTKVWFRELSDEEIQTYIQTGEPMDKAGAYGIQGRGCIFIEKIEGDFFNVMGLPASALYGMLKETDVFSLFDSERRK